MSKLSEAIKELWFVSHVPQPKFADRIKTSKRSLGYYIHGYRTPPTSTLVNLGEVARELNRPDLADLFTRPIRKGTRRYTPSTSTTTTQPPLRKAPTKQMAYKRKTAQLDGNYAVLIANALLPGIDFAIKSLESEREKYRSLLSSGHLPDDIPEDDSQEDPEPVATVIPVAPTKKPVTVARKLSPAARKKLAQTAQNARNKLEAMRREWKRLGGEGRIVSTVKLEELRAKHQKAKKKAATKAASVGG